HKEISLMHVAVHALARRDRASELVHDWMTALGFRNRFVGREAQALMSKLAPPTGIRRRTIVRVNNVTRRAAARAIIAGMIVRSEKSEKRIVQSCVLETKENGIGVILRAEAALG